jgi:hypothetical protein
MPTKKKSARTAGTGKPARAPKGFRITKSARPPKITINIEDKNQYKVSVQRVIYDKGEPIIKLMMRCFWDGSEWVC